MKAITAVCANGASAPTITNGRISRHRDGENDEIQMYLSKLKDLVPNMPKNKKISKLEVIQNVIDYICDLQRALETTSNSSAISSFDSSAVLCESFSPRQPLGVRSSPNTILLAHSSSETNASGQKWIFALRKREKRSVHLGNKISDSNSTELLPSLIDIADKPSEDRSI